MPSATRRAGSGRRPVWMLAIVAAFASASDLLAATVLLRGGGAPLVGERIDFELGGVRVFRSGVPTSVAWDNVQGVVDRPLDDAERRQLSIATDLWRARSRAQRGDFRLAGPLFERHFDTFRGTTSETALIVAEGLLRSSLATGREADRLRAIIPALEAARLRRAGVTTDRFASLAPSLDEATLLCTSIAPIWQPTAETERAAAEIERLYLAAAAAPSGAGLDGETAKVARFYVDLLRGARSAASPAAPLKSDPPAIRFLAAITDVQLAPRPSEGEPGEAIDRRAKARAALLATAKEFPSWASGWARLAAGRSAIAERDSRLRMEGVLQLLSVAALERDVSQALVVEALRDSAATLHALGERESAAIVERELSRFGVSAPKPPAATTPVPTTPDPAAKRVSALPDIPRPNAPRRTPARAS